MLLDERDRRVTFAGCRAWSERVAAGLAALGVGEGTPFTWQLPTRIESVVLSLALARLGAVQNPILPIYREREVGAVLRQTGARWLAVPGVFRGFDHLAMARALQATAVERLRDPRAPTARCRKATPRFCRRPRATATPCGGSTRPRAPPPSRSACDTRTRR